MKSLPSRCKSVYLLAGLYFGLARVFLALKKVLPNHVSGGRAMILPSLFALAVVNIFLKLYMG